MSQPPSTRTTRTVYRAAPPRRRRWSLWVLGGVLIAAVLATGAWQVMTAPQIAAIAPQSGQHVASGDVTVRVVVNGMTSLKDVAVLLDGRDVTAQARFSDSELVFNATGLTDGQHTIELRAGTSNLYRRSIDRTVRFTVDTAKPQLDWLTPKPKTALTTDACVLTGTTEPNATVSVGGLPEPVETKAAADGRFSIPLSLADGRYQLSLTARDAAGNSVTDERQITVDTQGPDISVAALQVVKKAAPKLNVLVEDAVSRPRLIVKVDGEKVYDKRASGSLSIKVGPLSEGAHTIEYKATDAAGHVATRSTRVVVDSTETLGTATLSKGAIGKDVAALQKLLKQNKAYPGEVTGAFDDSVRRAVVRFQERNGLPVDGIAGPTVIAALSGRIVVDQSECRLYFYSKGKLKKWYPVAVGQPAWPTPNGTFRVVVMAKNPTWIPPDSPWAKGLEPVPPGAGNPLGTRWIGTSAPGVGIHGTPASYSIGTHSSHGCIRMYISDVEQLFEWVQVGMPVIIRS